jgi:hypothetical protein
MRTSPDCFHTITEIPSLQSFSPLPTVGMMCNGRYLIARTLEFHRTEKECSLLDIDEILQDLIFSL